MDEEKDPENEREIIKNTRKCLRAAEQRMSREDRSGLWMRINSTTERKKRRRLHLLTWTGSAAAGVLLFAAAVSLWKNRPSLSPMQQMQELARTSDTLKPDEVELLTSIPRGQDPNGPKAYHTVIVPYGKTTELRLNDGSQIWLNSGSKLVYPVRFRMDSREVYLEGEAYFKVEHDGERPFHVRTPDMNIRVLGTEFNVSAYRDDARSHVMLVSGSVELTAGDAGLSPLKTLLVPREMAVYDPSEKELEINSAKVDEYVSWRTGYMSFQNTPLSEILKKLERYYGVEISLGDASLGEETFTGPLDLKKDVYEVLDIICVTTSAVYREKERRIILEKL